MLMFSMECFTSKVSIVIIRREDRGRSLYLDFSECLVFNTVIFIEWRIYWFIWGLYGGYYLTGRIFVIRRNIHYSQIVLLWDIYWWSMGKKDKDKVASPCTSPLSLNSSIEKYHSIGNCAFIQIWMPFSKFGLCAY